MFDKKPAISVKVSRRFNLGDFNSVEIEAFMSVQVENQSFDDAYGEAYGILNDAIQVQADNYDKKLFSGIVKPHIVNKPSNTISDI